MELSIDQKYVLKELITWYANKNKTSYITVGGYAGTGKTTLIAYLRKYIYEKINKKHKVAFCSYTGRAVQVLKNSITNQNAIYSGDITSTIHGLIYSPLVNSKEEIIGWEKKQDLKFSLLIIDESSMVNEDIFRDLLSYNIPIIAVGDHGQLAPIEGVFNLMEKPQLQLENIHRQAENNPIIDLSVMARNSGVIPANKFTNTVIKFNKFEPESGELVEELLRNYKNDTIVLCGYNNTRNKLNQFIRQSLGFESAIPQTNDRVICLRNNAQKQIFNGMLGTIKRINQVKGDWLNVEIEMDDTNNLFTGLIYMPQFGSPTGINFTNNRKLTMQGDLFDYGYALTVHKSQGTEMDKVILFEERFKQMDDLLWKKWLYTAVTRAKNELYIIG